MARLIEPVDSDNRVVEAKTDSEALGGLYDRHYGPVLRFCVHRALKKLRKLLNVTRASCP